MTKRQKARQKSLLPLGIPKYVRCYDNGGIDAVNGSSDRYTVVFSGNFNNCHQASQFTYHPYLAMSGSPFHPQGIGLHGEHNRIIDTIGKNGKYCWPPAIGRKNHLGTRISFSSLPPDCRKLVLRDYKELWDLA